LLVSIFPSMPVMLLGFLVFAVFVAKQRFELTLLVRDDSKSEQYDHRSTSPMKTVGLP
jgi:hypothetical protein